MVLRPARAKWIAIAVIFAAMAAASFYAALADSAAGDARMIFIGFGVFSLLGVVGAGACLSPRGAYLELSPEGFSFRAPLRGVRAYAWRDVEGFDVLEQDGAAFVMFRLTERARAERRESVWARVMRVATQADGNLPDTYGLGPEPLAALLNEWRERFTP